MQWASYRRPVFYLRVPAVNSPGLLRVSLAGSLSSGKKVASPDFILHMTEQTELSERELEILSLVATGASNKEIAQKLYISANTVKVHLRNIFAKIGVSSRTEAAMYAVANNLVTGSPSILPAAGDGSGVEGNALQVDNGQNGVMTSAADASQIDSRTSAFSRQTLIVALVSLIVIGAVITTVLVRNRETENSPGSQSITTLESRWVRLSGMSTARAGMAVAVYENSIIAVGGMSADGVTGALEKYDPLNDRWEVLANKPTPVGDAAAAVVGGLIYVPGGVLESGAVTDVVEVYDPVADSWGQASSLPVPVSDYALAAFEGNLYLIGGWDGQNFLDTIYRYDPQQDEWTQYAEIPQPRAGAAAAVNGGKIYIAGGRNQQGLLADSAAFLPTRAGTSEQPWEQVADLPEPRAGLGLISVADILYAIGGEAADGEGAVESYALLPQENRWQVFNVSDIAYLADAGVTSLGRNIYVIGGRSGEKLSGDIYAYQVLYTVSFPVLVK